MRNRESPYTLERRWSHVGFTLTLTDVREHIFHPQVLDIYFNVLALINLFKWWFGGDIGKLLCSNPQKAGHHKPSKYQFSRRDWSHQSDAPLRLSSARQPVGRQDLGYGTQTLTQLGHPWHHHNIPK